MMLKYMLQVYCTTMNLISISNHRSKDESIWGPPNGCSPCWSFSGWRCRCSVAKNICRPFLRSATFFIFRSGKSSTILVDASIAEVSSSSTF